MERTDAGGYVPAEVDSSLSKPTRSRTRILLVEENRRLLHALLQFLATEPAVEVVGAVGSPDEAVRHVAKLEPEVVLVDWGLPQPEAEEACRLMRLRAAPPKIVALLDDDEHSYRAAAVLAGADAVLGKGELSEALLPLLDTLLPIRALAG
jgi:DNA-binding NarL/FixJ family response regulator